MAGPRQAAAGLSLISLLSGTAYCTYFCTKAIMGLHYALGLAGAPAACQAQ